MDGNYDTGRKGFGVSEIQMPQVMCLPPVVSCIKLKGEVDIFYNIFAMHICMREAIIKTQLPTEVAQYIL